MSNRHCLSKVAASSGLLLQRRSRGSLLWGLAAFVLSQLALALAIEFRLPELRDPEYGLRIHLLRPRYQAGPGSDRGRERPFTIIMLGSSRATFGFRADQIEAALS